MIKRIKPTSRIVKIEAEINRIFGEAFFRRSELIGLDESWVPCVDLSEKREEIILRVELPGVAQKDIVLLLHCNRIEIKGIKKENLPDEEVRYFRLEREYGTFRRIVFLPSTVVTDSARASLENGVLSIVLKKLTKARDREVVLQIEKSSD